MHKQKKIPLDFHYIPKPEMIQRSKDFFNEMNRRRTVREFSSKPIPREILANAIKTAGTAPNGANLQPWKFIVITDNDIRKKIRIEAEKNERDFYSHRAPDEWLKALEPIGTDSNKHFLDTAPCQIAVFLEKYYFDKSGQKKKTYYPTESIGLATGLLISALHIAGLTTLTYTPSPMQFLSDILGRPDNERPYMLVVCGYPKKNAMIPDIKRKLLSQISEFI